MKLKTRPASLTARCIASLIDVCLIILYALCLFGVTLVFYQFAFGHVPDVYTNIGSAHLLGFVTLTLPVGIYFFATESGRHHATFGKRIAKISVISQTQETLSKRQIVYRTIIKLLPWECAHTFIYQAIYYANKDMETPIWVIAGLLVANALPLAYLAIVIFRKDRAGPHDLAAGTLVVKN